MSGEPSQDNLSTLFTQLILSFHAAAWQQMGKTANPFSGKVERNLEMAKNSIDILGMIEHKTKSNLTEHEEKLLKHILTELRMNYVEELKKPDTETEDKAKPETSPEDDSDKKE